MVKFSIIFIFTGESNTILLVDNKLPSIEFDGVNSIEFHLEKLCNQCINYSYVSLIKMLSGCEKDDNGVEIIYLITSPYMYSINKIGYLMPINSQLMITEFWSKYGKSINGKASCFR